jgi:hypothetical protein
VFGFHEICLSSSFYSACGNRKQNVADSIAEGQFRQLHIPDPPRLQFFQANIALFIRVTVAMVFDNRG